MFTVVSAHATDDPAHRCTAVVFESTDSVDQPLPSVFASSYAEGCREGQARGGFGLDGVDTNPGTGTWSWSATAGDAVRATLVGTDGNSYPVVSVDGGFYGWFPAVGDDHPPFVLTGYAADGGEVGHVDFAEGYVTGG